MAHTVDSLCSSAFNASPLHSSTCRLLPRRLLAAQVSRTGRAKWLGAWLRISRPCWLPARNSAYGRDLREAIQLDPIASRLLLSKPLRPPMSATTVPEQSSSRNDEAEWSQGASTVGTVTATLCSPIDLNFGSVAPYQLRQRAKILCQGVAAAAASEAIPTQYGKVLRRLAQMLPGSGCWAPPVRMRTCTCGMQATRCPASNQPQHPVIIGCNTQRGGIERAHRRNTLRRIVERRMRGTSSPGTQLGRAILASRHDVIQAVACSRRSGRHTPQRLTGPSSPQRPLKHLVVVEQVIGVQKPTTSPRGGLHTLVERVVDAVIPFRNDGRYVFQMIEQHPVCRRSSRRQ